MDFKESFSLKKFNTFSVDVRAKLFVEISSFSQALDFFKNHYPQHEKTLVLGGGSNLLFSKNCFDGIVIKNSIVGVHVVKEDADFIWVKAGAGVIWHDLVESCLKANFGGVENLALIPGTVGAAPIQNIGAYGVELHGTFEALEAIEMSKGVKRYFRNEECEFGYRDSIFKRSLPDQYFITHIVLRLRKEPVLNIAYQGLAKELHALQKNSYSIRDVADAVIRIRRSKLPDPIEVGNAGSFFKNPVISHSAFAAIKQAHPAVPHFNADNSKIKVPAAWLIDQCGLKGYERKGAAVHQKQPLVLVNKGKASGEDILQLSRIVQNQVYSKFGIELEPEVRII
jgi:UDP-N-acetylmuramate dehydrogenase